MPQVCTLKGINHSEVEHVFKNYPFLSLVRCATSSWDGVSKECTREKSSTRQWIVDGTPKHMSKHYQRVL